MPKISISFVSAAASAIERSEKGTVLLIVRDTSTGMAGNHWTLTSVTQIPAGFTAANKAYIQRAFAGYINPPKKVVVYAISAATDALEDVLDEIALEEFDYLCGPSDLSAAEAGTIKTWITGQRANSDAIFKAVLPNLAADSEAIINFATASCTLADGTTNLTSAQMCSRIAGLLAGTPMRISATYAPLYDLADCSRLSKSERDTAVGTGKLIVWWDGRKVKIGRAVNSLTTTSSDKGDAFKKIKIMEAIDMVSQDIRQTIADSYIGKYPNTYDNKLLLQTAISAYLRALESDSLIDKGWTVGIDVDAQEAWLNAHGTSTTGMTEQEIREANTGSEVFMTVSCKPVDAIEDVTIPIHI